MLTCAGSDREESKLAGNGRRAEARGGQETTPNTRRGGRKRMNRLARPLAMAGALLAVGLIAAPASAQAPKHGGIWKIYHRDSPASASIHEEATFSTVTPFMPVFNNLVLYKQDEPQNSMQSIVPDLAASWSWSEDGTELTFKLRQGVKWHDGKPFTAADVKCTYDLLLGRAKEKLRINPRKAWFRN